MALSSGKPGTSVVVRTCLLLSSSITSGTQKKGWSSSSSLPNTQQQSQKKRADNPYLALQVLCYSTVQKPWATYFFIFCFQGARWFCLVLSNNSPTFLKGFQSFFFGKPGELKRSQQKGGCQETVFKDRLRYTQFIQELDWKLLATDLMECCILASGNSEKYCWMLILIFAVLLQWRTVKLDCPKWDK